MSKLIGTKPHQVPSNADLGTLAYADADRVTIGQLTTNHHDSVQGHFRRIGGQWSTLVIEAGTDTGNSRIAFNDPDAAGTAQNSADGMLDFEHSNNSFRFHIGANNTPKMVIYEDGYLAAQSASQVRLVLGSTGQYNNNTSNWIRGTGNELGFNTGGGGYHWEITGTKKMGLTTAGRIELGTNTSTADQSDYGISIFRKGTSSSPPNVAFTDAAIKYAPMYGQGPTSYIQSGDFIEASYGRVVTNDSNTHNFAIINISYDSGLSPLRLDGRGNMWLGHNRSASQTDSTNANSLRAAGKIYAGTGFNNNGVREYAQALSSITNNVSYTFDVPIQATGAGYTVYYECMYNHFGNTSYGSWRSGMFSFRSLSNSTYYDDVIINHGNTNAGSWTVTMVDAGTSSPKMRFTKSAGSYPGSGAGHIFVRGGLVE